VSDCGNHARFRRRRDAASISRCDTAVTGVLVYYTRARRRLVMRFDCTLKYNSKHERQTTDAALQRPVRTSPVRCKWPPWRIVIVGPARVRLAVSRAPRRTPSRWSVGRAFINNPRAYAAARLLAARLILNILIHFEFANPVAGAAESLSSSPYVT